MEDNEGEDGIVKSLGRERKDATRKAEMGSQRARRAPRNAVVHPKPMLSDMRPQVRRMHDASPDSISIRHRHGECV